MSDLERRAVRLQVEKESRKREIVSVLGRVGSEMLNSERASSAEIRLGDAVLAYFISTADPNRVIQVQASPNMKAPTTTVTLREMDYKKLMGVRERDGDENEAVIREIKGRISVATLVDSFGQLLLPHLPLPNSPKKAA